MNSPDLALVREPAEPSPAALSSPTASWRPSVWWRALLLFARVIVPLFCRLRVTGGVPERLRGRPYILAVNHIGNFDPIALTAACARLGIVPRIMATGGLFRAPVVGSVLRRCGHLQVDRGRATVTDAFSVAVAAVADGAVVAGYPEGRISLDPALWPERGRTGIARLALATAVPVIPVAQWGAHEVMAYHGYAAMLWRLVGSVWRRPVVRLHFGEPVTLSDLSGGVPGHAQQATDRIMTAIMNALRPLRAAEPSLPRYVDPTRPVTTTRVFRPR